MEYLMKQEDFVAAVQGANRTKVSSKSVLFLNFKLKTTLIFCRSLSPKGQTNTNLALYVDPYWRN